MRSKISVALLRHPFSAFFLFKKRRVYTEQQTEMYGRVESEET